MWRILAAGVLLMLVAGTYVAFAGDMAPVEPDVQEATSPSTSTFGFALAAGMIALCAIYIMQPRRRRFR